LGLFIIFKIDLQKSWSLSMTLVVDRCLQQLVCHRFKNVWCICCQSKTGSHHLKTIILMNRVCKFPGWLMLTNR